VCAGTLGSGDAASKRKRWFDTKLKLVAVLTVGLVALTVFTGAAGAATFPTRTQLTLKVSNASVTFGQADIFSGTLQAASFFRIAPIVNANVHLLISTDRVHWTEINVASTNANGAYSISQVIANTSARTVFFRTHYAGSVGYSEAFSPTVAVTQTLVPIEYQVALPQSMIDDGEIQYFGAHRFTTVYLVAGDTEPYTRELNLIKSLGMKPVIDVEFIIWENGNANKPIASFASYFQSLKDAGWQYVASEAGRPGDPSYLRQFFSGYVNYNVDHGGLWQGIYKDPLTTRNSWESYYSSEVTYIYSGTKQAAVLGIQNGIMGGVWGNSGGNNQILDNSRSGVAPSYKSMLDWSYANAVGFTSFEVWFHPGPGTQELPIYKDLGFEQVVANLQAIYPPTGSWIPPTRQATTLTLSATQTAPGTFTFSGTLSALVSGTPIANGVVYLHVSTNGGASWTIVALPAGHNPTATASDGSCRWTDVKLASGTYYFRAYYPGDAAYLDSFAPSVHGIQVTV
jgi:hypothetical protein